MSKTDMQRFEEAAIWAATQSRLIGLGYGGVSVKERFDGRSVKRITRELLATGLYRPLEEGWLALTDEGLQTLAARYAVEPKWPVGPFASANQRNEGLNTRHVFDGSAWAWLYLHANECVWQHRTRTSNYDLVPYTLGERAEGWDIYVIPRAVAEAQKKAADEARIEQLLRRNLGRVLVYLGLLEAGDDDVFESAGAIMRGMPDTDRWTTAPAERAASEIESLRLGIARAERRLRVLSTTQAKVEKAGGWDAVMGRAREAVREMAREVDEEVKAG
jgi:hypothetical protein